MFRTALRSLALTAALLTAPAWADEGFTNRDFKGDYAFHLDGVLTSPGARSSKSSSGHRADLSSPSSGAVSKNAVLCGGTDGSNPSPSRGESCELRTRVLHDGVGVSVWYMVQARSVGWRWNEFLPVLHHLQHP